MNSRREISIKQTLPSNESKRKYFEEWSKKTGWSSAAAASSSSEEQANRRLLRLLRSYDVSVRALQMGRFTAFLKFFGPY
jgi:pyrroloquinoline quinone (PQQ) biosynthesis protein C